MTVIKHRRMNRQTDWQGERDTSSLWSITSWISISITGSLLGGPRPGAWVGGGKPPRCQQWLASSSAAWRLCVVLLLLLLSFTPVRNYTDFIVQHIPHPPPSYTSRSRYLAPPPPPPTSLCKHFTIFKHNAITPNFHTDVGSRRQTFAFPQSSLY